jgi:hypothetical protein
MAGRDDWKIELTASQIFDLERAADQVVASGRPTHEVDRDDFPLGEMADVLASVADQLEDGRGFVLLRGLPVERYTIDYTALIYWGMGVHLGIPVSQNAKAEVMVHVRAVPGGGVVGRGYQNTASVDYHSDASDVVGLLCVCPAMRGGESTIASAIAVHDEMLRRRPDLVDELYQPLPGTFYKFRNHAEGEGPYLYTAPFSYYRDKLSVHWYPLTDMVAEHYPEVGQVSDRFDEAKKLFNDLAVEYSFSMGFQPGDIQFLNNYTTVHARHAFEDHPDPGRTRDLLRIWITLYNGRPLAPNFEMNRDERDPWGGRGWFATGRAAISL